MYQLYLIILGFRISCIPQCGEFLFFLSEDKTILDPGQQFLNVGSREIIPCSLENETNHLRWFNSKHQEINSTSGTRVTAKTNGELTIEDVQVSDGGTYECRGLEYTRYYTIYVNGTVSQLIFTSGQSSLVI